MRMLIIFIVWAVLFVPSNAQATFSKIISNYPLDPEAAWTVAEVPDGYIIVSWGDCLGQDVIICGVLSKLDKNGNIVWFKQFDYYPHINTSLIVRDNKIYVSGGTNQGDKQFVLYCLDMDGNIIWVRKYGDLTQDELGPTFTFTSDNHILLCGTKKPNMPGMPWQEVYLLKIDMDGEVVDEYIYDFQNDQSLGHSNIETTDHQQVFSYNACPVACLVDFSAGVASIDTSGNINWNLELPFSFQPDGINVVQEDSSTLVVNWHTETNLPNHDLCPPTLFYLDLNGQIQDSLVFENQSIKEIKDLEAIWGKGLLGCGRNYINYITDPNPGLGGWVFRVDENKEVLWDRTYSDTSYQGKPDRLQSIAHTSDCGYIAVGRIVNNMTGVFEAHNWILKLDSLGCLSPGCGNINYITDTQEAVFLKGKGIKIYPNPASDYVHVAFPADFIPGQNTNVVLISNAGTIVRQEQINAADCQLNLSGVTAGMYYLMILQGNEIIDSKRVIVQH